MHLNLNDYLSFFSATDIFRERFYVLLSVFRFFLCCNLFIYFHKSNGSNLLQIFYLHENRF